MTSLRLSLMIMGGLSLSLNALPVQAVKEKAEQRPKPLGLTVSQALKKFGPDANKRLLAEFARAGIAYPPKNVSLLCLKSDKVLLSFARTNEGELKQISVYPLVSYSGELGPKLKEGDMQIPEGFYKTPTMDANTHLCLWVNYPNDQDRANARADHRTNLGGDIQIHEGVYSSGCLVISHDSMAELFVLAHDIGVSNLDLIIAPCNLLVQGPPIDLKRQPVWVATLYKQLKKALAPFPIKIPPLNPGDANALRY